MFRKLVIIAIVMGMAGWSLAVTIGNPTSSNSWSTAKYVTVTASTAANRAAAVNLINGSGIDSNGLYHGVDWADKIWYAVSAGPNTPATKYSTGIATNGPAWVAFVFDDVYKVKQMKVWNDNEYSGAGDGTEYGVKSCTIEYSTDGVSWTTEGSHTLSQGPALGWDCYSTFPARYSATQYACNNNVSLGSGGINAKYVVLIVSSGVNGNFSSTKEGEYALSEVRFVADSNRATMPDPMIGEQNVLTSRTLTWVKGDGTDIAKHKVYLSTDQTAVTGRSVTGVLVTPASYTPTGLLVAGKTYYWAVDELNASNAVVTGGTGVVWSFAVPYCTPGSEPASANGNLNSDCYINFKDFAIMCDNWHKSGYWPQ